MIFGRAPASPVNLFPRRHSAILADSRGVRGDLNHDWGFLGSLYFVKLSMEKGDGEGGEMGRGDVRGEGCKR